MVQFWCKFLLIFVKKKWCDSSKLSLNQNIFWNKIPWFLHQYTAPCVSYRPSKQSAAATVDILESFGLFSYVLVQRPLDKYDTVCGVFLVFSCMCRLIRRWSKLIYFLTNQKNLLNLLALFENAMGISKTLNTFST